MSGEPKRGRPKNDSGAPKGLTPAQIRGVNAEIKNHPSLKWTTVSDSPLCEISKPFHKPAHHVAMAAGVSKRSVEKWRKESALYVEDVKLKLREELNAQIADLITIRLAESDKTLIKEEALSETGAIERGRWIKRHWREPVKCPIDGQIFEDPDTYFLHMEKHKVVPYELIEEIKAKK
jgi:hypothetical protein